MDIYAIVTEKIINLLESGVVPGAGRGPRPDCRAISSARSPIAA